MVQSFELIAGKKDLKLFYFFILFTVLGHRPGKESEGQANNKFSLPPDRPYADIEMENVGLKLKDKAIGVPKVRIKLKPVVQKPKKKLGVSEGGGVQK